MQYDPSSNYVGGFTDNDGTIDFYLRINSLLSKDSLVVDFGAGRGAWFEEDKCETRKSLRLLKGKVKKVIAVDIDKAVLKNKASDEQILLNEVTTNLKKNSIDLIISDYVLEHIDNPKIFSKYIGELLKPGGWFCARTPHKYSYVAIFGSLFGNKINQLLLRFLQPNRKEEDIFPTRYKLNTLSDIRKNFKDYENWTFIYKTDPAYFFGNKKIYILQKFIFSIMPRFFSGNLMIFVKKN